MNSIKLPHDEWLYDPTSPLGKAGGFGCVYRGQSRDGKIVAVKQLHISAEDAAHRELRIADDFFGKNFAHVVPLLDAGQDADSERYYVVMARADKNLAEELKSQGKFSDNEAADILLQIARGLAEVPQVVHRDLKPANVLFHEGAWKLADFGIARFVEESTSLHTLKGFLSAPYAAPEQ
jgi:serine/threonine-protein kinase